MKDCFVLRFNLENAVNPETLDRTGALAALFGMEKSELEESAVYYGERLTELASAVDKETADKARGKLSKKKIAFFGDSLTSDRLSYANIIKKLGVFEKADTYAVSGTVSSQMLRQFRQQSDKDSYDYVCIFIGTNDSAFTDVDFAFVSVSEFKRNLLYAADIVGKKGVSGIVFKLPYHNERKDSTGRVISEDYNAAIDKVAKEKGLSVFDVNEADLHYIDDNVHFTDITQKNIAELFLRKISGDIL